jgi:hypothetical protein
MIHPSEHARTVHIGKLYRPQRFEVRTPTSYSARLPELGSESARLQRALLRPPLDAQPLSAEAESALWDRIISWGSFVFVVAILAALSLHWI